MGLEPPSSNSIVQLLLAVMALLAVVLAIAGLMFALLRWARNYNGRLRNAVGHALEDLDRHTTRPSLEKKIEHESQVVYEDDEHAGD